MENRGALRNAVGWSLLNRKRRKSRHLLRNALFVYGPRILYAYIKIWRETIISTSVRGEEEGTGMNTDKTCDTGE